MTTKNKMSEKPNEELETDEKDERLKENTVKPKKTAQKSAFMYLGPTVREQMLINGSVYKEIPSHLDELFLKAPALSKLFIEVKDVSKFKADVINTGTIAHKNYNNAVEELKEV